MTKRSKGMGWACAAIGVIAAMLAGVSPGRGAAQAAGVPTVLAGTWTYDGTAARAMNIMMAAFEPGIRTFPELFQGFARDRVRSSNQPPSRIVVALEGSQVRVTLHTDRTIVIGGPLGGIATTTTGVEGDTRVTTGLRGGWLEVLWDGEGDMQQLFSTEPDGSRMHVDFTVIADRLPAPVRYRLDYVHPAS